MMFSDASQTGPLHAWLYDVDSGGKSWPMAPENQPLVTPPGAKLHVTAEGGQNTKADRYLKVPRAEGMATEPVTVGFDLRTGYWMIRNNGRSNSLRVQQYGLAGVPLYPGAAIPMGNEDVAVWIPIVNSRPRVNDRSEAFRLLILATEQPPQRLRSGGTLVITAPRRMLNPNQREAIIAYFGDHLSWPPLPAPHVRKQSEVENVAQESGLVKKPSVQRWARNRHDVLSGPDGLFTAADWYPKLGGNARTIGDNLAAFYRLVELRTITRSRVRLWAGENDVAPYVMLDEALTTSPARSRQPLRQPAGRGAGRGSALGRPRRRLERLGQRLKVGHGPEQRGGRRGREAVQAVAQHLGSLRADRLVDLHSLRGGLHAGGAQVAGIGHPADQAALVQRLDHPGQHRRVKALQLGQLGQPQRPAPVDQGQHGVLRGGEVRARGRFVEHAGEPRDDRAQPRHEFGVHHVLPGQLVCLPASN